MVILHLHEFSWGNLSQCKANNRGTYSLQIDKILVIMPRRCKEGSFVTNASVPVVSFMGQLCQNIYKSVVLCA